MIVTTNTLTSGSFPVPIAPTFSTVSSTGGPFSSGSPVYASLLNQMWTGMPFVAGFNAIVTGFVPRNPSGTVIEFTQGTITTPVALSSPSAGLSITLPASSTVYLWATVVSGQLGLAYSSTTTPPAGSRCYLGQAVVGASTITSFDTSGVVYASANGLPVRTTGDPLAPTDTPPSSLTFLTQTLNGTYLWNNSAHCQITSPNSHRLATNAQMTLVADLTITPQMPNVLWLIASSANRNVTLPATTDLSIGHQFTIVNAGNATNASQNYNLAVKNPGGTTVATITPGMSITIGLIPPSTSGASSPVYPASLTPVSY